MQEKKVRWKTSLLLFSICLCFSIFLISCDNLISCDKPSIPDFKPDSEIKPGPISDRLVARIYFDATLSMQGFVVPGSTRYTQMCPYLERAIVSGWTEGKVDFFRFGERVESIDRGTYLQAGYESFYEQEHISRKTFIQKIIDHEEQFFNAQIEASRMPEDATETDVNDTPEAAIEVVTPTEAVEAYSTESQLVVIVTDLFQDASDITLLINHLKEKYIKRGREVGLFGLQSQFDGTVYDIGSGEGSSLRYRSTLGNPETFRPFYLLVLGKHADIAHYFDGLTANNPDAKTIIFSRYLVSPLLSFDDAEIEIDNLNIKIINSDHSQDPRLKQYEIVRSSEPAKISAKIKYVPLPHAISFDPKVPLKIDKPIPKGGTEKSPEGQKWLEAKSGLSENELTVKFTLSEFLPGKAIYLYEVTLSPDIDAYQPPGWCSDWDMGGERDGAKTLNLVNFVRGLSQVTARAHHPEIAKFYCYIEKR